MDDCVRRWWMLFAVALFLLLPVDLLTTLLSVAEYGIAAEANPVMRWLLTRGVVEVILAHLLVVGVVVYAFHLAVDSVQRAPAAYRPSLVRGLTAWLGLLVVAGIVVVSNNVLVFV